MSEKDVLTLKRFTKLNNKKKKEFITNCSNDFIQFLCECVINVLDGNVPINISIILDYEIEMRHLRQKSLSNSVRRKILSTPGGLNLIKSIQEPVLNYLTT